MPISDAFVALLYKGGGARASSRVIRFDHHAAASANTDSYCDVRFTTMAYWPFHVLLVSQEHALP